MSVHKYTYIHKECGCEISIHHFDHQESEIGYCPKHAAASDMYEALELLEVWQVLGDELHSKAVAALKAAGDSDD